MRTFENIWRATLQQFSLEHPLIFEFFSKPINIMMNRCAKSLKFALNNSWWCDKKSLNVSHWMKIISQVLICIVYDCKFLSFRMKVSGRLPRSTKIFHWSIVFQWFHPIMLSQPLIESSDDARKKKKLTKELASSYNVELQTDADIVELLRREICK